MIEVVEIIMERDGLSRQDAMMTVGEAKEMIMDAIMFADYEEIEITYIYYRGGLDLPLLICETRKKKRRIKMMNKITLSTPRNYTELEGYQYFDIRILKDGEEIGNVTAIVPPEGENRDSTYIDWIGIDEAHRNHGYGTQALHLLVDLYGDIHLSPTDEDNQRLYERLGEEAHWELGDVDQGYGVYSL